MIYLLSKYIYFQTRIVDCEEAYRIAAKIEDVLSKKVIEQKVVYCEVDNSNVAKL